MPTRVIGLVMFLFYFKIEPKSINTENSFSKQTKSESNFVQEISTGNYSLNNFYSVIIQIIHHGTELFTRILNFTDEVSKKLRRNVSE